VWPKVIGIISVFLGGLQILCGFVGMVTGSAMTSMMRSIPRPSAPRVRPMTQPSHPPAGQDAEPPDSQPSASAEPRPPLGFPDRSEMFSIPDSVHYAQIVSLLAAGVLLLAGIFLIQKRRAGARLHLVYAAVQAIAVLASVAATIALMNSPNSGRGSPWFRSVLLLQTMGLVGMQINLGLAYPVFLLIWFQRKTVRVQVSQWPARNAAQAGQADAVGPVRPGD